MTFFGPSSLAALLVLLVATVQAASPPDGFRQFGNRIVGRFPSNPRTQDPSGPLNLGSAVELSDDGKRMLVGAPNDFGGAVFLYERETPISSESVTDVNWHLVWELQGKPRENLGEHISLSKDGNTLAVRRFDSVEVYEYDSFWLTVSLLGSPVPSCDNGPARGHKAVKLGETTSSSTSMKWLLMSCEAFDNYRGRVEILRFDDDASLWLPFTSLEGRTQGSRFGWSTGFFPGHGHTPRIAISSPNFDLRRGMIQVFQLDEFGGYSQVGDDLLGDDYGDQFGFSMDINSIGGTYIVAGAPQCDGGGTARGCVKVYCWRRPTPRDLIDWQSIGETLIGPSDNDRFGRAVTISSNGDRIAASSFHYDRQTGLVRLYERTKAFHLEHVVDIKGDSPLSRWGVSVALNKFGSMVASGSVLSKNSSGESVGSVQAFLDATPFCGLPLQESNEDLFLTRNVCRDVDDMKFSPADCSGTYSFGLRKYCMWVDNLATSSPSTAPSAMPSWVPSSAPSAAPSNLPSSSPSRSTSILETAIPSSSPSSDLDTEPDTSNLRKGKDGEGDRMKILVGATSVTMAILMVVGMGVAKKKGLLDPPEDHQPAEPHNEEPSISVIDIKQ